MTRPPLPLSLPRRRICFPSATCRDDHHRDILLQASAIDVAGA
jgi:hypothetical protein